MNSVVFYMRKLKLRKATLPTQGHTAGQRASWLDIFSFRERLLFLIGFHHFFPPAFMCTR